MSMLLKLAVSFKYKIVCSLCGEIVVCSYFKKSEKLMDLLWFSCFTQMQIVLLKKKSPF